MSGTFDQSSRQVIPRWLSYPVSNALSLLKSADCETKSSSSYKAELSTLDKWRHQPNWMHAIDLVAGAIVDARFGDPEVGAAANHLIKHIPKGQTAPLAMARHYIAPKCDIDVGASILLSSGFVQPAISSHRLRTSTYSHDPISWADLSLSYAICGQRKKSLRAMTVALGLGRYNRFILRSAARCFVHFGEPDRALAVLRQSELRHTDPWIVSSEIAIAETANLRNSCLRTGRRMLEEDNLSHFSRSELAATISTLEFTRGSSRKAKTLMRSALLDPTENAVAQAEWMSERLISSPTVSPEKCPASFEARTQNLYHSREYQKSIDAAKQWAQFQPVSSRPIVQASFVASVILNDDLQAIAILETSPLLRQNDPILVNNYSFAMLRQGKTVEARQCLEQVDYKNLPAREKQILSATHGLLAYRMGDFNRGRELYSNSVSGLERIGEHRGATIARCFWALEEIRIDGEMAISLSSSALARLDKWKVHELAEYRKELEQCVE